MRLKRATLALAAWPLLAQNPTPAPAAAPSTASPAPAQAEVPRASQIPALDEVSRVGVSVVQRRLTLEEAVKLALQSNVDVEIERTNQANAVQGIRAAEGLFDPTFRYQSLLQSAATPTGSVLQAADGRLVERTVGQNAFLRVPVPRYGTVFNGSFENNRLASNNPFLGLNPFLTSRLVLSVTQPLLRNRETNRERTELRVRRKQAELADTAFETRLVDIVARVEQAYWDLAGARQSVQVNRDFVELARRQLDINQRLVKAGVLAPIELAAAEAELQRRIDTYFTSLQQVTELENALKTLLTSSARDPLWNDELVPVEANATPPPDLANLPEFTSLAVRQRPELRTLQQQREVNDIQKAFAADQRKPQVDLVAGYISQGLGGTVSSAPNPFSASSGAQVARLNQLSALAGLQPLPGASFGAPPESLVGGYGTALSNLFTGNFSTFQAGVNLDLNLRNRTAEATFAQAQIGERRIGLERTRAEQTIEAQVRNALQAIQTARQRITAAEASARASQEKLESETRLFQNGESTNFLVLTRQNELADSRRRVVVAQLDLNKAVSRLQQSVGSTLRNYQITVR